MTQTKPPSRSSLDRFSPINLKPIQDDAWSSIFKPPPNESVEEKRDRIARQQEAQRVSREIDEGILESKKLFDKKKKAIKVLLLGMRVFMPHTSSNIHFTSGQAESGKSTMLRSEYLFAALTLESDVLLDFQLAFCPTYFHGEALIWKTIIQLNLIG